MRIVLVIAGVIAFLAACFLFIRSEGGKLAVSFGHDSKIKNILRYPFGMRAFFAFANVLLAVFALVLDFLPLANIQESTAVKIVLLTFAFVIILIYCRDHFNLLCNFAMENRIWRRRLYIQKLFWQKARL